MAIIIETCPKCEHDLHDIMLASNPPIPKKICRNCGWSWTGKPEQVISQPFGGNSFYPDDKYTLIGSTYDELVCTDDTCCMANNSNGYVYTVSNDELKSNAISYERLAESVEKIKEIKQGF